MSHMYGQIVDEVLQSGQTVLETCTVRIPLNSIGWQHAFTLSVEWMPVWFTFTLYVFFQISDALVSRHDAQLQCDKQGHTLPEVPVGNKVGHRNHLTNNFDIEIVSDQSDQSYTIIVESGRNISRNLKWTKAPFEPVVSRIATSHAPSNNPSTNAKHSDKANLTKEREKIRTHTTTYKTCSGHILRSTTRLITQM